MKYFRDFLVFLDLLSQSRKGKRSWSFIITFYSKKTAILHFFNQLCKLSLFVRLDQLLKI